MSKSSYMRRYRWPLVDGNIAEIYFSEHYDVIITKYIHNTAVEGAFFMDSDFLVVLPHIMRYCFEQNVDLRKRKFLKNLPPTDVRDSSCHTVHNIDPLGLMYDFQQPLRSTGPVGSVNNNLVLAPKIRPGDTISFDKKDVAKLVEGTIKIFDREYLRVAQNECICIVNYYHECLDRNILKL